VLHDVYDEMGCHVRCFPSKCLNLPFKSKKSFRFKLSFNQAVFHCWYYVNLIIREEGNSVMKNKKLGYMSKIEEER
jgi:hypothetical protein